MKEQPPGTSRNIRMNKATEAEREMANTMATDTALGLQVCNLKKQAPPLPLKFKWQSLSNGEPHVIKLNPGALAAGNSFARRGIYAHIHCSLKELWNLSADKWSKV